VWVEAGERAAVGNHCTASVYRDRNAWSVSRPSGRALTVDRVKHRIKAAIGERVGL